MGMWGQAAGCSVREREPREEKGAELRGQPIKMKSSSQWRSHWSRDHTPCLHRSLPVVDIHRNSVFIFIGKYVYYFIILECIIEGEHNINIEDLTFYNISVISAIFLAIFAHIYGSIIQMHIFYLCLLLRCCCHVEFPCWEWPWVILCIGSIKHWDLD